MTGSSADLAFVCALAHAPSLTAAARELGVTKAAVSKRLAQIEARLGVALVTRTTRRMQMTPEGRLLAAEAARILDDIESLERRVGSAGRAAEGRLRVNATLGFGRSHVGAVVSSFVRAHPRIEVQLSLSVDPPPLTDDAYDVCIRFGEPPDARVLARRIARHRRVVCAAPAYLQQRGTPQRPADLARHDCIGIRQGDDPYGTWRFTATRGADRTTQSVRVRGPLTTNDGAIAVHWALAGHGLILRAQWDVQAHLDAGSLVEVLSTWRTPNADIWAVWPQRHRDSARVRLFVEHVARTLPG